MRVSVISSLFQKKLFPQVVSIIEKDIAHSKQNINPKILYFQALAYANLKNYEKALKILDKVIASNLGISYNYQCHMLKGYLHTINRDYDRAELEFNKLLLDGYESSMVYCALGHVSYCLRKKTEAVKYLEKAIELDSSNFNALNSISYVLTDYNIDLERAIRYMEYVIAENPRNPTYLDTYGYILFKIKRFREAEKILSHAYLLKSHPVIKKHLDEVQVAIALQ